MNYREEMEMKLKSEAAALRPQQENLACDKRLNEVPGQASPYPTGAYRGDECVGVRRASLREEAEQRVGHHRIEADRADRAAAFFREHPEFDEFIQLIRSGTIQI